jgi:hypothetical protein
LTSEITSFWALAMLEAAIRSTTSIIRNHQARYVRALQIRWNERDGTDAALVSQGVLGATRFSG